MRATSHNLLATLFTTHKSQLLSYLTYNFLVSIVINDNLADAGVDDVHFPPYLSLLTYVVA